MMATNPIRASQPAPSSSAASHHHPLEPTSGSTLLTAALARRATLAKHGAFRTGCAELDNAVLLNGGFERGCVVGVSAEEDGDEVGLVLGLQAVAGALLREGDARVLVVTPVGVPALVGALRGALRGLRGGGGDGRRETERELLGRVSVARVFDVFGLWEVLAEVDGLGDGGRTPEMGQREETAEQQDEHDAGASFNAHGDVELEQHHVEGKPMPTQPASDEEEHAPSLQTTTPPAHQPTEQDAQEEPSSSPLSDPPSTLPNTPPWEGSVEMPVIEGQELEMNVVDEPRRTPPGLRDEIQDSEEEDEGFSSPLAPPGDNLRARGVDLAREVSDENEESLPELNQRQNVLTQPISSPIYSNNSTPPAGQARENEQRSQATADSIAGLNLEQEEESLSQAASTDEQDGQQGSPHKQSGVSPSEIPEPTHIDTPQPKPATKAQLSKSPDIILITHMSTLLSALFHQRDKATAHQTLQLLASHLRYMTRSPEHGGPLIMILNSTTSSDFNSAGPPRQDQDGPPRPAPPPGGPRTPNKPIDPTLRSVFNPPPLPVSGLSYNYDTPHSRRNKPSFGLIFTQMLDMHLLCTKIPKTRADAEALYAPTSPDTSSKKKVDYVWAVEVLLDEIGLWEGAEKVLEGKPRRSREQRWGAVEVRRDGGCTRLTDAFQKKVPAVPQRIVLAAGFGGRRV